MYSINGAYGCFLWSAQLTAGGVMRSLKPLSEFKCYSPPTRKSKTSGKDNLPYNYSYSKFLWLPLSEWRSVKWHDGKADETTVYRETLTL